MWLISTGWMGDSWQETWCIMAPEWGDWVQALRDSLSGRSGPRTPWHQLLHQERGKGGSVCLSAPWHQMLHQERGKGGSVGSMASTAPSRGEKMWVCLFVCSVNTQAEGALLFRQYPLLAPSVRCPQMVWECVCVWMEWTWSMHYVGRSTYQFIPYYASATSTRTHASSNHLRIANRWGWKWTLPLILHAIKTGEEGSPGEEILVFLSFFLSFVFFFFFLYSIKTEEKVDFSLSAVKTWEECWLVFLFSMETKEEGWLFSSLWRWGKKVSEDRRLVIISPLYENKGRRLVILSLSSLKTWEEGW